MRFECLQNATIATRHPLLFAHPVHKVFILSFQIVRLLKKNPMKSCRVTLCNFFLRGLTNAWLMMENKTSFFFYTFFLWSDIYIKISFSSLSNLRGCRENGSFNYFFRTLCSSNKNILLQVTQNENIIRYTFPFVCDKKRSSYCFRSYKI